LLPLALLVVPAACGGRVCAQGEVRASYEALLDGVKKGDPKADFGALRLAFTRTPAYRPYDAAYRDRRDAMLAALEGGDYAEALRRAAGVLDANFVDVRAHVVAYKAHAGLEHPGPARFHRYVFDGLVRSILQSGNGKSPETAFVVISADEEDTLLSALGIRRDGQALVQINGHNYDRVAGRDAETGRALTLYFNIDRPTEWLARDRAAKR
jgi:hypothetical protein